MKIRLNALVVFIALLIPVAVNAQLFGLSDITPAATLRDGTIPPRLDTTLFVFDSGVNPVGTQYTAVFDTFEQPAMVVGTAIGITNVTYSAETGHVTVTFVHTGYMSGIEADLPGPATDFAIAFVRAAALGDFSGPPAVMRGSWMTTNVSPNSWELIPPTPVNKSFGFALSGPSNAEAFFKMFVPQAAIDALSQAYGEPLTPETLAVFNDSAQAFKTFEVVQLNGQTIGILFDFNVVFSRTVFEFDEVSDLDLASRVHTPAVPQTVRKVIKVDRQQKVSLAANKTSVPKNTVVKLFGWVKGGRANEKVKITGGASKTLRLNARGYFSTNIRVKSTKTFHANFKRAGQRALNSRNVKVTVPR